MSKHCENGKCGKCCSSWWVSAIVVILAILPVLRTYRANDPFSFMMPNALLFTGYREEAKALWAKLVKIDTNVVREPQHIPEISAEDYSFETLRAATENFRYPAVVRGFFNGAPAKERWTTPGYLSEKIGHFKIPAVRQAIVGSVQSDRVIIPFSEAFDEIFFNKDSKMYIFFPVKSRFHTVGSDLGSLEALQEKLNEILREDLDFDRIWKGFGGPNHKNYHGGQLIMGQGTNDSDHTTGTGWHCAAGNNWFAQVVGSKRWYFMDPKYSAFMFPLRGGMVNMMTGTREMAKYQKHIPLKYADINEGDLLYNPDWEWHTIRNHEGLSIGCPIREANMSLSFQNNFQYTSIVFLNKIAAKFGVDIGGYPPN